MKSNRSNNNYNYNYNYNDNYNTSIVSNNYYNNTKSLTYRTSNLPGYNINNEICEINNKMNIKEKKKVDNWNTYQNNTWYQTYLNKLEREECPPGVQAEFRIPGVAETKVNLMESGKWREWTTLKDEDLRNTFESTNKVISDDYHAPGTNLNHSFRPHTTTGAIAANRGTNTFTNNSTINSTNNSNTFGKSKNNLSSTSKPITTSKTSIKDNNNNNNNHSNNEFKAPPLNPKTMFLSSNQQPIFGTVKQSNFNPNTTNNTYSDSMSYYLNNNNNDNKNNNLNNNNKNNNSVSFNSPISRPQTAIGTLSNTNKPFQTNQFNDTDLHLVSNGPDLKSTIRPMSSQALSRRHMGVKIDTEQKSKQFDCLNNKLLTLKSSNQLNHKTLDDTEALSYLNTYHHPHPQSGYDRGLKGTLLIDDWRNDELMKSDGKINFRPLSYDVLETLSYGPPDLSQKVLHEQNFPALPSHRSNLIQKVFSCLVKGSNSSNTITVQHFLDNYSPSLHPAVKSNRVTVEQVLQGIIFDMLGDDVYEQFGHHSNVLNYLITYEQFELHYRAVSSVIYRDEYFDILIYSTWNKFSKEITRNRSVLISQYSHRVDTADFESVMKSTEKQRKK